MSRWTPGRWSPSAARDFVLGSIPSCVGTDTDTWFSPTPPAARKCMRICARCPVRTSCLAGALARGEESGIWGGMKFGQTWTSAWAQAGEKTVTIYGRDPSGEPLMWRQTRAARSWTAELARAERLARKLATQGRRRELVAGWVRRVGMSVQSPGSWWIGPWTEPDPQRRTAQMRALAPKKLRHVPVEEWPWELRLLTEYPDSAIPKAGASKFSFEHGFDQDQPDDHSVDHDGDDHDRSNWRAA